MGKAQKKTGKGRLDKYYKLAKEQGYRARSAFKLIQLNKKYNFLESARCCIDLCAAPGGWLQVASKYMPVNSVIVGIDLVPIKPIPRVVTFAADITTPICRNLIRGELKDWKADIVLHDGAPNVGTAWVQDAYSQSELVLMSMKLAVEFLAKGGTFITKVFRSADYNNLLWVFKQLFGKVEATKPPSSRIVSAEIFVVCRDFLAPKQIDPKFFDPTHVFKDLSTVPLADGEKPVVANAQANVFQPEKKRRKRDGYDEGDYILFKKASASEFIRCQDPITFLGSVNTILFQTEEEKEWLELDLTSPDIKVNCDDLKVLGKGDSKALMKWRVALREEIGVDVKTKDTEELTEDAEVTEIDPEQEIEDELKRLNSEAAGRAKRERRRANENKQRTIQRMQLQMTAPLDIGLEQQDAALGQGQEDIFDLDHTLRNLKKKDGLSRLVDGAYAESDSDEDDDEVDDDEVLDSEEERERKVNELETELDGMYDAYQDRMKERDAKYKVKEARRNNKEREEWNGIQKADSDDEDESDEEGGWDKVAADKAKAGEESDSESDIDDSDDESPKLQPSKKRRRGEDVAESSTRKKARVVPSFEGGRPTPSLSRKAESWFNQDLFGGLDIEDVEDDEEEEEAEDVDEDEEEPADSESVEEDEDDFEIVPLEPEDDVDMWDVEGENEDELKEELIKKRGLTTAEAVTLAQQLVNREKTRTDLVNEGFNRYSLNSKDGLPPWFLDDENKHYKTNLPVTKEAITALRAKLRALDARPIKKIAEAKARKKMRAVQKLDKAMKKAEGVVEASDMTERAKASQVEKLMRKGMSTKKTNDVKVVVAKGAHRGVQGRPKGVKGRYLMVDSRMKKELRAKKRKEKANKKRKRS